MKNNIEKLNGWILKSNNKFHNKFDYSEAKYITSKTNTTIICPIHGRFLSTPGAHLKSKNGCKQCGTQSTAKQKSYSSEKYFELVHKKHGNFFDHSKSFFTGMENNIIVICPVHGEFTITAKNHLNNNCVKCRNDAARYSLDEFIDILNKKYNGKYSYPNIKCYLNNKTFIDVLCSVHGIFNIRIDMHLQGRECPICIKSIRQAKSLNNFITKSDTTHHNFYDYSNIKTFISVRNKVSIICPIHGMFIQIAEQHMCGSRCPECVRQDRKLTIDEFKIRAQEKHPNRYIYEDVQFDYISEKVKIICPNHGHFMQSVAAHIRGQGCPRCSKIISRGESEWLDYLNVPKLYRNNTIILNNKTYFPDGMDEKNKIIYEFYGDYWHGNPAFYNQINYCNATKKTFGEMYYATIKKEFALVDAGYKVISIWESDWIEQKKLSKAS